MRCQFRLLSNPFSIGFNRPDGQFILLSVLIVLQHFVNDIATFSCLAQRQPASSRARRNMHSFKAVPVLSAIADL